LHTLDAVQCASRGFKQHSFEVWKVADGMYKPRRIPTVLCTAAGSIAAICDQIFAKQWFTTDAMEARETRFEWIGDNAVTDCDVLNHRADHGDCACCFVTFDRSTMASLNSSL
jgi:hypothetical protein